MPFLGAFSIKLKNRCNNKKSDGSVFKEEAAEKQVKLEVAHMWGWGDETTWG